MAHDKDAGIVIAFPPTFFYPVGLSQKNYSRARKRALLKPESFAIHHWEGTWV